MEMAYLLAGLLDLCQQIVVPDRALHEHLLFLQADVVGLHPSIGKAAMPPVRAHLVDRLYRCSPSVFLRTRSIAPEHPPQFIWIHPVPIIECEP